MRKRRAVFIIAAALAIILLFFPYSVKHTISGDGEVTNLQEEKIGECTLSVEIVQTRCLLLRYKTTFFFTLNGNTQQDFLSSTYCEAPGELCLISQMYYDAEEEAIAGCSLAYPPDFSYASLWVDTERYYIQPQQS